MKNSQTFVNTIKKKAVSLFDKDKDKKELTPYRDWAIIVVVSVVILVLMAGIGTLLFLKINEGDSPLGEIPEDVTLSLSLDTEKLNQVIKTQNKKKELHASLLETPPSIIDPL